MRPDSGKMKTEFVFLALVILGLTAVLLFRDRNRVKYELPDIPGIERMDVDRMEIQSNLGETVLERKDGKWKLQSSGYPVDSTKLNSALDSLVELKLTTMVSASKDFDRYGMGKDQAIRVKAFAGDSEVRSLTLGKVASTYRHTFLRLSNDDRVFHAAGSLRSRFEYAAAGWRDKTVLAFTPDTISSLDLQTEKQAAAFTRKAVSLGKTEKKDEKGEVPHESPGIAWTKADGTRVTTAAMNDLLNSLASLSCEEFGNEMQDLDGLPIVLKISLKGDKDYHLEIRRRKENEKTRFIGTSSRVLQPFFLEEYTANDLINKAEELFKPETDTEPTAG